MERFLSPHFFLLDDCIEKLNVSPILTLNVKRLKKIGLILVKMRETKEKLLFLQRDRIFFSTAEFCAQSGRIILKSVGNTAADAHRKR